MRFSARMEQHSNCRQLSPRALRVSPSPRLVPFRGSSRFSREGIGTRRFRSRLVGPQFRTIGLPWELSTQLSAEPPSPFSVRAWQRATNAQALPEHLATAQSSRRKRAPSCQSRPVAPAHPEGRRKAIGKRTHARLTKLLEPRRTIAPSLKGLLGRSASLALPLPTGEGAGGEGVSERSQKEFAAS